MDGVVTVEEVFESWWFRRGREWKWETSILSLKVLVETNSLGFKSVTEDHQSPVICVSLSKKNSVIDFS